MSGSRARIRRANFRIPPSDAAQLDGKKLIVYRVDDYLPETPQTQTEENRFLEPAVHRHIIDAQPKWVDWLVGLPPPLGSDLQRRRLRQLSGGQRLIVRFYLFTGGSRDTEFTLVGAPEALADVAGVPMTFDRAEEQKDKERQKREPVIMAAGENASARCYANPSVDTAEGESRRQCLAQRKRCVEKYGDHPPDPISPEATELIACLDAVAR
jgi:hypothetical protein